MPDDDKKPRGRPRKEPWPEPIPDAPENIMRIIMRTPASKIRDRSEDPDARRRKRDAPKPDC